MSKFKKGFYTHGSFKDVFIEVLKVSYVGDNYTKLKIEWWNFGQMGEPYPLNIKQHIKVKPQHYNRWTRLGVFDEKEAKSLMQSAGLV